MKSRVIVLLAAAVMLLAPSVRGAPPDLRTQHLFHQLKILPDGATPFRTVDKLVLALVKRDPLRSVKYFKTALTKTKLEYPDGAFVAEINKLAGQIARILRRSELSDSQIKKITVQINQSTFEGGFSPSPTPTSTP